MFLGFVFLVFVSVLCMFVFVFNFGGFPVISVLVYFAKGLTVAFSFG